MIYINANEDLRELELFEILFNGSPDLPEVVSKLNDVTISCDVTFHYEASCLCGLEIFFDDSINALVTKQRYVKSKKVGENYD